MADLNYSNEIYYNKEKVHRAQLSANFKEFAFVCICEAISLYLASVDSSTKARNSEGNSLPQPLSELSSYLINFSATKRAGAKSVENESTPSGEDLFGNAGSLPRLWEKAAVWGTSKTDKNDVAGSKTRTEFRQWWARGVMARGHAEWLLQEISQCPSKASKIPLLHCYVNTLLKPSSSYHRPEMATCRRVATPSTSAATVF
jgi:hypothetical protein